MEQDPPTLGDLLLTLYEMGFTERQVRDALHAGCLSAPEAANWLLQERAEQPQQQPHPQRSHPPGALDPRAMDAFNPPRQPPEVSAGPGAPSLGSMSPGSRLDLEGVAAQDALGRAESHAFAEQQREHLAEQLKAERRNKRREHELALQRIADDRRRIQVKAELAQASPVQLPLSESTAQPSSDGRCMLTIRLPAGDSVRQPFPADCSLEGVRQSLLSLCPELSPSFAFLQGFPRRHFSPADLPRTLQALGLAPSATLCIVDPVPPSPASERPLPGPPPLPPPEEMGGPGPRPAAEGGPFLPSEALPALLHSPAQRVAPGGLAGMHSRGGAAFPTHHHWGRGQRLDAEEPMEQEPLGVATREEADGEEHPVPAPHRRPGGRPGFLPLPDQAQGMPGPQHQWPAEGNRLRTVDGTRVEAAAPLPLAVAQAAERRLEKATAQGLEAEERDRPSVASPPSRLPPPVPLLSQLSLQATVALLTAPSKQYCSSLASLTPVLAERVLGHMIRQGLLTPRSLRLFFGCPLQKLLLDCYPYATNELLRQLRAFPGLRHLSLLSCPVITDQGLSVLQHLTHLQHLNLSACEKLTDNCLRFLKGLLQLSHLALDRTRISDRGLAEFLLPAPPSLTHLSLNQTGVTDDTLRLLPQRAPHLLVLSLKQTSVTDVSPLRHLEALQTLHLDGTRVSEASLRALSAHPSLSSLTLSGVQSVDGNRALELVSGLPLAQLSLPSRHTVTDVGLAALCRLTGLVELDLTDYSHITDEGLQHLPQLCRLRRLSLCNTLVTDNGLPHIQGLQLLEELCLDRLNVSSAGVARCIVRLPHLQVLSLASTPVGDTVARVGLACCQQLLKVNLSRTRLTDRGLRFLSQVPLVQLNLDGSGVTALGVANLLATCPTVGSIRASHLRVLATEEVSDEE
ncbi:uncharacterized protein LOC134395342 [Elgaria multicarinata webbii]|uniref:uncharacterized protein LOC134395342 n=1 Tax=Elgaria multicarinata webbii TaxID=159646 RepID=UPI002FCD0F74